MKQAEANAMYARWREDAQRLSVISGLPKEVCYCLLHPDNEETTVRIIKAHLRTSEQKAWMAEHDLSIEDCLNGRYNSSALDVEGQLYKPWNKKLGRPLFGQEFFEAQRRA